MKLTKPYSIFIPEVILKHPLFMGSYLELTLQMLNSFDSFCAMEDYITQKECIPDLTERERELLELIKTEFAGSFE